MNYSVQFNHVAGAYRIFDKGKQNWYNMNGSPWETLVYQTAFEFAQKLNLGRANGVDFEETWNKCLEKLQDKPTNEK